jgi:hypothetical protein
VPLLTGIVVCGTLYCDTVLHLHSIYHTDMISAVSVPVTVVMYS